MHSFLALITIDEIEIVLVRYHSPRSLRQVVHNRHVNGEISDHSECRAPWCVLQLGWEVEVRLNVRLQIKTRWRNYWVNRSSRYSTLEAATLSWYIAHESDIRVPNVRGDIIVLCKPDDTCELGRNLLQTDERDPK